MTAPNSEPAPIPYRRKRKRISIRVAPGLLETVSKLAGQQGIDVNTYINQLLREKTYAHHAISH